MSGGLGAREILEDLVRKYEMLSKRIDSGFGKASASQLIRQMDALARIAKLILSYRSLLEIEEKEAELTRMLSEIRMELESEKRAMTVRREGGVGARLLGKILSEIRRLRILLAGEHDHE
ncbi:MAG: hypothetical protein QXK09_01360 [Nitrososphaerota archaeon]